MVFIQGSQTTVPDTSSSSEPSSPESEADMALADSATMFGLTKKDMQRPANCSHMQDLTSKQLAYCVGNSSSLFSGNQIFEIGGELESCMNVTLNPKP